MRYLIIVLLVPIYLLNLLASCKSYKIQPHWFIKTSEEATDRALYYIGFLEMEGFSVEKNCDEAVIVNIDSDQTPFLHQYINDRDIWKVTFKDITIMPYRGYPDSVDYLRTFDVYIDPDDGKLLKIESLYAGINIDFPPEPSIEWAEKKLQGSPDKFIGPASPDSQFVSYFDCLNDLGPSDFKQLKALLYEKSYKDNLTFHVWFVIYRGTHPRYPKGISIHGKPRPKYKPINYSSYEYNANNGKLRSMTNQPSPDPDYYENK